MHSRIVRVSLVAVAVAAVLAAVAQEDDAPRPVGQRPLPATLELNGRQWKVTRGAAPGYLPDRACAQCHRKEWETFQGHGMGRSFHRPRLDDLIENLADKPYVHEKTGLHYEMVERDGALFQKRYRVDASGKPFAVREEQVDWVIGSGNHSRGYLYQTEQGELYQLPMVWYSQEARWGIAPGFDSSGHKDFNRRISRECMFCHNAFPDVPEGNDAAGQPPYFPLELPEGVGCQRCHGPGARHVQAATELAELEVIHSSIVNPSKLEPRLRDDVCDQCHLQPDSRMPAIPRIFNRADYSYRPGEKLSDYIVHLDFADGRPLHEKFELNHHPYRLRQSRCFVASEGRLHCLTCHDPHRKIPAAERAAHYRARCLGCHEQIDACKMVRNTPPATGQEGGEALDMENLDCTQCHMPERRTEDAIHITMTDHRIQRGPPPAEYLAPAGGEPSVDITDAMMYFPERSPGDPERVLYRWIPLLLGGNHEALLLLVETLEAMDDKALGPSLLVAAALRKAGKYREALELLREFVERHPDLAVLHAEQGYALLGLHQLEEAQAALRKALILDDRDPEIHFALGGLAVARGDRNQAYLHYERAIERRPHYAAAHFVIGKLEVSAHRLENARRAFERTIASDSTHGDAYHQLGHVDGRQNRVAAQIAGWRRGLRAAPRHAGMLKDLATILLICRDPDQRDFARSVSCARKLAEVAPLDGMARLLEALALLRRGRPGDSDASLAALEKAEQLGADEATRLFIVSLIRKLTANTADKSEVAAQIYKSAIEAKAGTPNTQLRRYIESKVRRLFEPGH